jgi:hypothetical protein
MLGGYRRGLAASLGGGLSLASLGLMPVPGIPLMSLTSSLFQDSAVTDLIKALNGKPVTTAEKEKQKKDSEELLQKIKETTETVNNAKKELDKNVEAYQEKTGMTGFMPKSALGLDSLFSKYFTPYGDESFLTYMHTLFGPTARAGQRILLNLMSSSCPHCINLAPTLGQALRMLNIPSSMVLNIHTNECLPLSNVSCSAIRAFVDSHVSPLWDGKVPALFALALAQNRIIVDTIQLANDLSVESLVGSLRTGLALDSITDAMNLYASADLKAESRLMNSFAEALEKDTQGRYQARDAALKALADSRGNMDALVYNMANGGVIDTIVGTDVVSGLEFAGALQRKPIEYLSRRRPGGSAGLLRKMAEDEDMDERYGLLPAPNPLLDGRDFYTRARSEQKKRVIKQQERQLRDREDQIAELRRQNLQQKNSKQGFVSEPAGEYPSYEVEEEAPANDE